MNKWHIRLSTDAEDIIVKESGGILLLAKAVLRIAKERNAYATQDIQHIITSSPDYKLQIQLFLARLTPMQQSILQSGTTGQASSETEAVHLRTMGILELTTQGYRIRSNSVRRLVKPAELSTDALFMSVTSQTKLSRLEESLLKHIITHEGEIISRDTLAEIMKSRKQGTDVMSDWSIDKAISRLRHKLLSTDFHSIGFIETRKKIGVVFKRI